MNNQAFLQKALAKSFLKPMMTEYNNIDFTFCRDSSGHFLMGDKSECKFAPCLITTFQVKEYINNAHYDIRHSRQLNNEYESFKHYFEENIIIPETNTTTQSLRLWLGLTSVSRQAAQKKRVIATLMPPCFKETIADMEKDYRSALQKIQICEKENLDAVEIALISDFTAAYDKTVKKLHWADIIFFKNKKLLKQYLLDALDIICEKSEVPPEFEIEHAFLGHTLRRFNNYSDKYRSYMFNLISKMQNMADNDSLLHLVRLFLTDKKTFSASFKDFRNERRAPNLDDILAIKKSAQIMFDEFTKLCYLEGVRSALEINYLDECPSPQNPPLPSVNPNEEMGKIRNIVEESRFIDCKNTKTGQLYYNALNNFTKASQQIDQILINYIGIPSQNSGIMAKN